MKSFRQDEHFRNTRRSMVGAVLPIIVVIIIADNVLYAKRTTISVTDANSNSVRPNKANEKNTDHHQRVTTKRNRNNTSIINDDVDNSFRSPDTEDFYRLVIDNPAFVDKSLFIRDYLLSTSWRTCLFAQPRGYGKSVNFDMLKRFLDIEVDELGNRVDEDESINRKLFVGGKIEIYNNNNNNNSNAVKKKITKTLKPLKISTDPEAMKYQGKYPVLYFSFKDVNGSTYDEIVETVKMKTYRLLNQYDYAVSKARRQHTFYQEAFDFETDLGKVYLEHALFTLCNVISDYFGGTKIFIIVDEYDTPIMNAFLKYGPHDTRYLRVRLFVHSILDNCFKDTFNLYRGLIGGILPIRNRNFIGPANVNDYLINGRQFYKYFGFTRDEVEELLKKTIYNNNYHSKKPDMRTVKNWYYAYKAYGTEIYNSKSIMTFVAFNTNNNNNNNNNDKNVEFKSFWNENDEKTFVGRILTDEDDIQFELQNLAVGRDIPTAFRIDINFELISRHDLMMQTLTFCGYLTPTDVDTPTYDIKRPANFSVPNNEIEHTFKNYITRWVCRSLNVTIETYRELCDLLSIYRVKEFANRFDSLVIESAVFNDTHKSKVQLFYRGFIIGLLHVLSDRFVNVDLSYDAEEKSVAVLVPTTVSTGSDYQQQQQRNTAFIIIGYKIVKSADDLKSAAKAKLKEISTVSKSRYNDRLKRTPIKRFVKLAMAFSRKKIACEYQTEDVKS